MVSHRRAALTAIVALSLGLSGCGVNSIPTKGKDAQAKWTALVRVYRSQEDLIPELAGRVNDPRLASRIGLDDVQAARARVVALEADRNIAGDPDRFRAYEAAQADFARSIDRMTLMASRQPRLAGDAQFLTLVSQLGLERAKISDARARYNRSVGDYNAVLKSVSGLILGQTLWRDYQPMQTLVSADILGLMAAGGSQASLPASGAGGQWRIELHGVVPVICYATVGESFAGVVPTAPAAAATGQLINLGALKEVCNNGQGFDVYAVTPANQTGAAFTVNGQRVPVSPSGTTLIDTSNTAVIRQEALAYDTGGNPSPDSMTFSVMVR